jgi:ribosomal protein L11 methyltransferase
MEIKQIKWFALEITVDFQASEAIEFALNELDALGTEINNLGKDKPRETLCVVGYFNEKPNDELLQNKLTEALRIYNYDRTTIKNLAWSEVENKDWLEEWKKHWKPTETDRFIVAPPWSTVETNNKIVIRIDPSMAFGTGTHETTRLCLKAIEENYKGESFFDVGTGTGILAIAVGKLATERAVSFKSQTNTDSHGAEKDFSAVSVPSPAKILACDTDEDSIKIAEENAEINAIQEIEFYVGSINEDTPKFDFVCANLTADVIIPLLPLLVEKAGKTLLLSGILKEQEESVVSELRKFQADKFEVETDGEWISVLIDNGKRKIEN